MVNDLVSKVERQGQAMWAELEAEQQTPLVDIRRSTTQFEVDIHLRVHGNKTYDDRREVQ